jgi:hypothetical protein
MAKPEQRAPAFLSVRDFDRLQHYRDRALRWVKLYVDLLDDFEFQQLPDTAKFHVVGLMLLAARMGNKLPNNSVYLSRQIGANAQIDLELLQRKKFLIPCKRLTAKSRPASSLLAEVERPASLDKTTDKTRSDQTTDETARPAPVSVVTDDRRSKHTDEEIGRHVDRKIARGEPIRSRARLVQYLARTGEDDAQIDAHLASQSSGGPVIRSMEELEELMDSQSRAARKRQAQQNGGGVVINSEQQLEDMKLSQGRRA